MDPWIKYFKELQIVIQTKDLHFQYSADSFSLRIPDVRVESGEKVAITGASGSGKTTFLSLLSGILLPNSGEISVGGNEVSRLSDRKRREFRLRNIGFVFQDFELIEYLSAHDNILLPFRLNPAMRMNSEVVSRASELASKMGIDDKMKRYPSQLSQGEKQRVALCRALITNPEYVFADEATGNLDPANKKMILDLLLKELALTGGTLLAITHDHELIDRFDRTIDFNEIAS